MDVDVLKRVPVREQEPKVRATNFEEVCYGYDKEEAMAEASRCLNCKNAQFADVYVHRRASVRVNASEDLRAIRFQLESLRDLLQIQQEKME